MTRICKTCHIEKPLSDFVKEGKYYRPICKSCYNKRASEYRKKNKETIDEKRKNNRDKTKADYYKNHKKRLEQRKKWRMNNRDKINIYRRNYDKTRNSVDPQFRLNQIMSRAIRVSLKNNRGSKRGCHWGKLVGYRAKDLRRHLDLLFTEGMTWDNYGQWHIDHIIPKSVFNYNKSGDIDFKKCWALNNLQPLWANDNIRKANKLKQDFQPSLAL